MAKPVNANRPIKVLMTRERRTRFRLIKLRPPYFQFSLTPNR